MVDPTKGSDEVFENIEDEEEAQFEHDHDHEGSEHSDEEEGSEGDASADVCCLAFCECHFWSFLPVWYMACLQGLFFFNFLSSFSFRLPSSPCSLFDCVHWVS